MRPELARNFLIGLTAIVVLFGISAAGVVGMRDGWLPSVGGGASTAPTVMVLSRKLLENGVDVNIQESDRRDKNFMALATKAAAKHDAAVAGTAKAAGQPLDDAKGGNSEHDQAMSLALVGAGMEDQLSGTIIQSLEQSGRFRPIPSAKVSEALATTRKNGEDSTPEQKFFSLAKGGKTTVSGETASTQSKSISEPVVTGLKQLSSSLGAEYTMIVTIGEPRVIPEFIESTTLAPARVVMSAQPIISCELFSNKGKEAYRFTKQFDKRVSVTVTLTTQSPNLGNYRIAFDRINTEISRVAAQQVLAWGLDKIAPARVMRTGEKIIINRGSNDGVQAGAVYQVERETGDPVMEGGVDLGRLRVPVGSIVIQDAQERIATASIGPGGGAILKDDIVKITGGMPAAVGGTPGAETLSGSVPLGSQALAQVDASRTSGIALRQANVAVDAIIAGGTANAALGELIADSLAQDPRITILPRAQLGNLVRERTYNAASTGEYENSGLTGMRASGYLISGDFSSSSSTKRHANTVSVGGITQTVSVSTSTSHSASGTLRATSVDGKQVQSIRVSAGSLTAAAQMAAREMLLKLFPMKVVQVAGTELYVNRGQDAGIRVGAHLKIYHLGAPIIDRQTGAVLSEGGRSLAGEAVVTDVQANVSAARLVGSGDVASEGDVVQLLQGGMNAGAGGTAPRQASAAKPPRAPAKPKLPKSARQAEEGLHF